MQKLSNLKNSHKIALIAGIMLVLGSLTGFTFSMWADSAETDAGMITSGTLDISLTGTADWSNISTDNPAAPEPINSATYLAVPGDAFQIDQDFTTSLRGENMLARLDVNWEPAPTLPVGIVASYEILDSNGDVVQARIPIGSTSSTTGVPLDTQTYTLRVYLTYSNLKGDVMMPAEEISDIGNIVIDLEQLREGEGYTP